LWTQNDGVNENKMATAVNEEADRYKKCGGTVSCGSGRHPQYYTLPASKYTRSNSLNLRHLPMPKAIQKLDDDPHQQPSKKDGDSRICPPEIQTSTHHRVVHQRSLPKDPAAKRTAIASSRSTTGDWSGNRCYDSNTVANGHVTRDQVVVANPRSCRHDNGYGGDATGVIYSNPGLQRKYSPCATDWSPRHGNSTIL